MLVGVPPLDDNGTDFVTAVTRGNTLVWSGDLIVSLFVLDDEVTFGVSSALAILRW
jgi:hypothetical protein